MRSTIKTFELDGRTIGPGHPCYIIAEAGPNHNGDIDNAFRLVDAAAAAGADAVKFQTGNPLNVMSDETPKAEYQRRQTGADGTMLDMIKKIVLSFDDFRKIKDYCDKIGILFLSTPFDLESVDFLVSLGMPAIKVPSGEINNPFLLKRVATQGRPVLLSTGMAYLSEIAAAVHLLRENGTSDIALFQCVSNYPSDPEDANLRTIPVMADAFGIPCGFSDHSLGRNLAVASVALGANMIEKHFTLDRSMPGPDHAMSLEPSELMALVKAVREVESALGDGVKRPREAEFEVRDVARRSLSTVRDIKAGATIAWSDMFALRPARGLSPMTAEHVVGRKAARDIPARALLSPEDFI